MSVSIVISVIMGRVLERLGFTDALMRIFMPIGKLLKFNAAVLIPAIYNILGDINAAGRIAGPILVKSKATLDEKKLAIFTMVQSEQSFSTFMLGLGCLTLAGARVFAVVVIAYSFRCSSVRLSAAIFCTRIANRWNWKICPFSPPTRHSLTAYLPPARKV
jgi:hypothetical protein